ncbi:MAG TPA: tubulin-like doman-containing protein, partial [Longimicrobium sp.]|nr:tubulin-like doman-containing protein [Longimicrobium sp.]
LVRQLSRTGEIPSVDSVGYLVLPSVFAQATTETERLYANAYAALKELEYFSARKDQRFGAVGSDAGLDDRVREISAHDLVVDWEATGRPVAVVGPPFNSCFLVGNAPYGGSAIPPDRKGDLFDMIAENIFLDFSRQRFSDQKRSLRSNLEDYLKNELEYTYLEGDQTVLQDVLSFRFSAFGLSKMYVPVDRIRRACAYRLAMDLMDRWLVRRDPQGDLRTHLRETEAEALAIRVGGGRDDLRERLDRVDDAGKTLAQAIAAHWETERREQLRQLADLDRPGIKGRMGQELDAYRQAYFNRSDDEGRWGAFIRRLRLVTGPRLRDDLTARLEERLHAWLNTETVRLPLAGDYLKTVSELLADLEARYRKSAEARTRESTRMRTRWEGILDAVEEEETGGPRQHRWSVRVLIDEACATVARHFEHAAYAELFTVGADVLAELQRAVGSERVEVDNRGEERTIRTGLVQRLYTLIEAVGEARAETNRRLQAFDRAEEHLVFTNLYDTGMFREFYQLFRPDGSAEAINERTLRDLEIQMRDELQIRSPWDLHDRIRGDGLDTVRGRIEDFAARPFARMHAGNADAVTLLSTRPEGASPTYDEILQRLVEKGNAWLRPNERARQGGSPLASNYAVASLLGLDRERKSQARYAQFEDAFVQRASRLPGIKNTQPSVVDTDPDVVLFYSEQAGVPLAYIEGIDGYRRAYRRKVTEFLHLDRRTDRFMDVALKDAEEVKLAVRVTRAVVLGVILRVVEVTGKGDETALHHTDQRRFPPQQRHLGTRLDTVELLSADRDLLSAIESGIEERIRTLDVQRTQQFFTLLSWHVLDGRAMGLPEMGPFAPRDVRVGESITRRVPIENRAIEEALETVRKRMRDMGLVPEGAAAGEVGRRVWEQWYPVRNDFAEPVSFGSDTVMAFRQFPVQIQSPAGVPLAAQDAGGVFDQELF